MIRSIKTIFESLEDQIVDQFSTHENKCGYRSVNQQLKNIVKFAVKKCFYYLIENRHYLKKDSRPIETFEPESEPESTP